MSTSQSAQPVTWVLIPGAWCAEWAWRPVARHLRGRGHHPLPLTMPGLGYGRSAAGVELGDAVDTIVREIEDRSLTDVVLVAHSWGGYPATGAAHRVADRIQRVVYYNAVVPAAGRSMVDENEQYAEIIHQAIDADPDRAVALPPEAISDVLMPDASVDLQMAVAGMTVPQPGSYMTQSLDVPPVNQVGLSATYILGEDDNRGGLARPGAEFAARLGTAPITVPGGHMGLITHAEQLTEVLLASLA